MEKEKIIQIAYGENEIYPTLLTESGKVYKWQMDKEKFLGNGECKDANNNIVQYPRYGYSYSEVKTI